MTTYEKAYEKLKTYGQLHVLQYYEELSGEQKEALLAQIMATDFSVLTSRDKEEKKQPGRGQIAPLAAMELEESGARKEEFERLGLEAIRAGKVGAVLLAVWGPGWARRTLKGCTT